MRRTSRRGRARSLSSVIEGNGLSLLLAAVLVLVGVVLPLPLVGDKGAQSYDARDRLTQEVSGTGQTTDFALDPIGNATGETTGGQPAITRTFNGQQLATVAQNGVTNRYLYDPAGNLDCVVESGWAAVNCPLAGTSQLLQDNVYDYAGRLAGSRAYDGAGGLTDSADYVNDPLDRPVSVVETHVGAATTTALSYVGVSDAVSSETLTGTGATVKTYAYDVLGQRATLTDGASRYSYLYDPHGSVSLLLDQASTVMASYGYNAYGGANSALTRTTAGFNPSPALKTNAYEYTGKRYDTGSATLDMGARRYSATTGRFLQPDVYYNALDNLDLANDPLTQNRYLFTGANPVNYIELDGHLVIEGTGSAGGSSRWIAATKPGSDFGGNNCCASLPGQLPAGGAGKPAPTARTPPRSPNKPNRPNKPARAVGALGDEVAATFKGGQYTSRTLDEEIVLRRVYGGTSPELGPYWSRTSYSSTGRAKQYLALPPGNTAERVVTIRVPAGTTIYEGKAAAHYGRLGGGNQVYIPRVDPAWIAGRP